MPGESFRFIHASDFHLERPLGDLDELPKHLRDSIAEAPWKSAEAIFEGAVVENVDFVILCGDLLSPSLAGPRGLAMLMDGFEALLERQIQVFWASGQVDASQYWPESIPLPENIHRFPKGRAAVIPVTRGGQTIAVVVGRSSEGFGAVHVPSYRVDPTGEFTIGVGYGSVDAANLEEARFDYWALGGSHDRRTIEEGATHGAVYCGTPQGRRLEEAGAHGYTLVDVDAEGSARVQAIDVDTFRYCRVRLEGPELTTANSLRQLLAARIGRLQAEHGTRHLLIGWDLHPTTSESLDSLGSPSETLTWLRREFGSGSPSAWTVQLKIHPPQKFPKQWHDEDTILGDFLRAAERHRKSAGRDLNLLPLTEEHPTLSTSMATLLADVDSTRRSEILGNATLLGVNLLRGGKSTLSS